MGIADLFGRHKKPENRAAGFQPAPGTSIRFDPALIPALKQDHRKLLQVYKEVHDALAANDLGRVKAKLGEFRTMLQGHLLTENVRLYVYLVHQMQGDATNSQIINDFRHEMDTIGRSVTGFLRKYADGNLTPELAAVLAKELEPVGTALGNRIRNEEDVLYPLYQPSY